MTQDDVLHLLGCIHLTLNLLWTLYCLKGWLRRSFPVMEAL